ncbi:Hypothetical predicted protein [Olea europaea subsp. europaea]|uniref:BEACH domain-containing protein n=1 Tax=Olea europaea subsp. europaea TaxID=158383 RepID=A0A8S0UBS3_OLEEU|nr:Hypothetical predicted protein [Olea europaea subsp. europaea]
MHRSKVERKSQFDIVAQRQLYPGVHEWRKLIHCLIEMKCLFRPFCDHLYNSENVIWKLVSMESSSRMRSVLRTNYRSSDHFGAAEEHEDNVVQKLEKDKFISPSKASILAPEAILIEVGNEEDEQEDDVQFLMHWLDVVIMILPVFTWFFSDYNLQNLDLYNPASHGDLLKPIGALNADRLNKIPRERVQFDDQVIPKFHYGSHYATAGTMLYYLIRLEPFTTLSIQIQGGKFDHAERMSSDIAATWNGVLEDMIDVKKLVSELFYLLEVFTNENSNGFCTTRPG